ncbi:hypothetical protein O9929_12500 [Vibrio lentus]|nr:hypothetical protein [Vibrio lentus]
MVTLAEVRKINENTLFYGEGWDFGEVADNARFDQAGKSTWRALRSVPS